MNIQYSYKFSVETMGNDSSLDLCFINSLEHKLNLEGAVRIPQIILKPNATYDQQFHGFIRKISEGNTILPHLIYNDVEQIIITKSCNIIVFISSADEITPTFLNKLRNSHIRIFIIYSNENIINFSKFLHEIRKIFELLPKHEFSLVTLLAQRKRTWKIFTHSNLSCKEKQKYRLIELCRVNGTHVDIQSVDVGQKCPFHTLVTNKKPFVLYNDETGFYGGIEIALMNTLTEKLKLNFEFILNNNSETLDYK